MAKIFTITEGLENLGALKSGGQGSVYKARRTGEIITAIKILPTPISSESDDDKNFTSFQNEVQKLKKVNEIPNPNVVSIIASGITSSGNLPYIEMEYIEGPDLAELLKPPYDPVFTIKETIKVADHLSNALAHCHRADVKHGDIKSNNVKFNQRTGNYILLDFGLSVMSDEQRRTSIRHAGAIEFMAPEQSDGEMHFETDIYSFGIILFELLAGTVPFPLHNKGEMARNAVMLSHMETLPPDLLSLRRQAMPVSWINDKKERQIQVPSWLVELIYKCLEKAPAKRFQNGMELQEFIHSGIVTEESKKVMIVPSIEQTIPVIEELQFKRQIQKLELQSAQKDNQIEELQTQVEFKDKELYQYRYAEDYSVTKPAGVSKTLFFFVLVIALGFTGFTMYKEFIQPYLDTQKKGLVQPVPVNDSIDSSFIQKNRPVKKIKTRPKKNASFPIVPESTEIDEKSNQGELKTSISIPAAGKKYKVIRTAFFHASPDANSRSNVYLPSSNEIITAIKETKDFIYIEFTNSDGKINKGWLLKKNLDVVYEY